MSYIAHIKEDGKTQTVKEHNERTALLATDMATSEMKKICYVAGLLHDIGKYQTSFQKRISGDKSVRIEHSSCGAKLIHEAAKSSLLNLLIANCIIGHHTGLPDMGNYGDTKFDSTLYGRLKRETEDYSVFEKEQKTDYELTPEDNKKFIELLRKDCKSKEDIIEKYCFYTKYCFSCLTDADSIDTAEFMSGKEQETLKTDFVAVQKKLDDKLNSFINVTDLQNTRSKIQSQAYKNAEKDSEIYLMNMPTGSGKTLCSMKTALIRLLKKGSGKKRIIYVIPYNSIIEQTAGTFDEIFGNSAQILRHQSTFFYNEDNENELVYKYATENWDADLIVTTSVQFFESLFGNKRSKLRKLHNMANSIIVFDEAHLMPIDFLQPCLRGISFLTKYFNSEAIFLTATMPDFKNLITKYALENPVITDLITDVSGFGAFDKCKFRYIGEQSDEALIEKATAFPTCLIVVNSRKGAREIYNLIPKNRIKAENIYHLSTYMTPFDRINAITEIKNKITELEKDFGDSVNVPDERKIIVVSTSLIEAGVDLDFFTVFREIAGLDNILQTGGRCNREGKRNNAEAFIFKRSQNKVLKGDLQLKINITQKIIDDFGENITSPEAVSRYYRILYGSSEDIITRNSLKCQKCDAIPFAEQNNKIIDSRTVSIAVNRDEESCNLFDKLRSTGYVNPRKIQNYCFTVYQNEFEDLLNAGVVKQYDCGIILLENNDYYDDKLGITFESKDYYCD